MIESNKGLSLQQLSLTSGISLPKRPGYGTLGKKIVLRVNWFHLLPEPKQALYRYSVQIVPNETVRRKLRRVFALLLQDSTFASLKESVATDCRSTLISAKELNLGPQQRKEIRIVYCEEGEEVRPNATTYVIKIEKSRRIELSELLDYLASTSADANYAQHDETVQALNIVMARKPLMTPDVVQAGQNKWYPIGARAGVSDLGGGLVALRGYYASVRTATLRIMANVNVCTGAFYKPGSLLELMREFREQNRDPMPHALDVFLRRLRVETRYLKNKKGVVTPKVKTISGLARRGGYGGNAESIKFECTELGGTVSVAEYFLRSRLTANIVC